MPGRIGIALTLSFCVIVALAGCAAERPSETPSISGVVRERQPIDGGVVLLVEAEGDVSSGSYDNASVRLDTDTTVLVDEDGTLHRATPEDVPAGASVDVWFEGPVAESYPVQAAAGTVLVVGYEAAR
jgi:beta-N-acetylhexosaminidase